MINVMPDELELVTLEEAARTVGKTPSNIRYYLQYGRINVNTTSMELR